MKNKPRNTFKTKKNTQKQRGKHKVRFALVEAEGIAIGGFNMAMVCRALIGRRAHCREVGSSERAS